MRLLALLTTLFLAGLLGCLGSAPSAPVAPPSAPVSPPSADAQAQAFYAAQPPYLRPIQSSAVPAGLTDVRASTCGACHAAIYEEWKVSTHARAWLDDAQFQAELRKPMKDGADVTWMCVNCHTPMTDQLPRLVVGLTDGRKDSPIYADNPGFDAALQLEAITCATCHVRDGVVLGPWGDTAAPHPVQRSEALLGVEMCTPCHQAEATFPELTLACTFTTGEEYAAGPYPAEGKTCPSCHMPEVTRPITRLGTPARPSRRHWFGGSLIPKKPEYEAEVAAIREHYVDGLELSWGPGAAGAVEVRYTNAQAGHLLPTGDPERFLLIELEALSADGRVLTAETARVGTTYRWWPDIEKLGDNRMTPRETRSLSLIPPEGTTRVRARASKHRISPEAFAHHELEGKYVAGRTFAELVRDLPPSSPGDDAP